MDDNEYLSGEAPPPHIAIDRQVVVGDTQFLITASGSGGRRIDLAVVGCDRDGLVVSEISGGISPRDLPAVADVLTSTLAGLVALHEHHRSTPAAGRRRPNHGARWTPEEDARLAARHRAGASQRELMDEFGRSRGGIRARLEHLGLIETAAPAPPAGRRAEAA
jgi:hypothetical protein